MKKEAFGYESFFSYFSVLGMPLEMGNAKRIGRLNS